MDQKIFASGGHDALPTYKTARPKLKVTQRTLNIICEQLEAQPGITSQEIKEKNPVLVAGMAE